VKRRASASLFMMFLGCSFRVPQERCVAHF
jgi:hypothetical protein